MPPSLIVVLGPTTTGKTMLATTLAQTLGGELINADKFYTVQAFPIGTGRADVEQVATVPRHLYAYLPATRAAPPSVQDWLQRLFTIVADIRRRGRIPIVEGSSFGLAAGAARLAARIPHSLVLGLRLPSDAPLTLQERIAARIQAACHAGLLEETEHALQAGYGQAWVQRKSVVYPPIVAHLAGSRSLSSACEQIGAAVHLAAQQQARKFMTLPDVQWRESPQHALETCAP